MLGMRCLSSAWDQVQEMYWMFDLSLLVSTKRERNGTERSERLLVITTIARLQRVHDFRLDRLKQLMYTTRPTDLCNTFLAGKNAKKRIGRRGTVMSVLD